MHPPRELSLFQNVQKKSVTSENVFNQNLFAAMQKQHPRDKLPGLSKAVKIPTTLSQSNQQSQQVLQSNFGMNSVPKTHQIQKGNLKGAPNILHSSPMQHKPNMESARPISSSKNLAVVQNNGKSVQIKKPPNKILEPSHLDMIVRATKQGGSQQHPVDSTIKHSLKSETLVPSSEVRKQRGTMDENSTKFDQRRQQPV